jgi:hypothetical protein
MVNCNLVVDLSLSFYRCCPKSQGRVEAVVRDMRQEGRNGANKIGRCTRIDKWKRSMATFAARKSTNYQKHHRFHSQF